MIRLKLIFFLGILIVLGMTHSTAPAAIKPAGCKECSVHVWWSSPEGGDGSAVHNVGEPFLTNADPSIPTVRSFTFPETNTLVTVSVEQAFEFQDRKFERIKIGLAVSENERGNLSHCFEWVYAESQYRKGDEFRFLCVAKETHIKNLCYTFELNCHKPSQRK